MLASDVDDNLALAIANSLLENPEHEADPGMISRGLRTFLGLKRVNQQADGSCVFHSLTFVTRERGIFDGDHDEMKNRLVDYILLHWDKFQEAYSYRCANKDAYITAMSKTGAWGGPVELIAFETLFRLRIYIVQVTRVGLTLMDLDGQREDFDLKDLDEIDMSDRAVHPDAVILYHAGESHYDVLVKDDEEEDKV